MDEPESVSPETLRGALADLPTRHRESLVLHYLEGRTVADAATALGISEGAFKVRLLRARRALRGHLERRLTDSLGRIAPRRSLVPGIMSSILVKSAVGDPTGTTVGTAALLATGLGKLLPLPLLFLFLPIAAVTAAVGSQAWAQRAERGNYRDPEGFRRRLYDDDRVRIRNFGAAFAAVLFGCFVVATAFGEARLLWWGCLVAASLVAVAGCRRFLLTRDWASLGRGLLVSPMIVMFVLMWVYELPSWFVTLGLCLNFLGMVLTPMNRPLRFDQNLFLRARMGLLPGDSATRSNGEAESSCHPPAILRAFARFGAGCGLFVSHRSLGNGLQLGLRPVCFTPRSWLDNHPRARDSKVTLFHDGRVEASLGTTDHHHLERLEIRGSDDPGIEAREVASAVRRALGAFAKGDRPAALQALGHLPDARIFRVAPSRTGFPRTHRLGGIAGILFLALMVYASRNERERSLAIRAAHLKPVPYSLEEARAIVSAVGYGNLAYSRHRWDAFLSGQYQGYLLPPVDWASVEGREFLKTNFVPADLGAIARNPARALRFLGDWRSQKALHFGWADAARLEAYKEAAPRLREALEATPLAERARLVEPAVHPFANAPGSLLALDELRWRLETYADLGLLDLFDTGPLVERIRAHQVLRGRPIPPERPPLGDPRDWLGLFRTSGIDPIADTYAALVVLDRLRALDTIDREACVRGLLRLHLGKGLFLAPQTWDRSFRRRNVAMDSGLVIYIRGDARTTYAARESLRLLGALDRVADLAAWEFRIHPVNGTSPALEQAHLGPDVWSRIEAVLLREASTGGLELPSPEVRRARVPTPPPSPADRGATPAP
ncbi:MAG: hypothetical protein JNL97_11980 [Verrucomicrobiales bacterium]|nr:hypothetical protein [Verrucomicrobiales bacterium]